MNLTFKRVREANVSRSDRWHRGARTWTPSDWMVALVGEVGEAANNLKKLRRIADGIKGNREEDSPDALRAAVASELADTFLYLDLLADSLGIDLEKFITDKFNQTSIEHGFPERL